MACILQRVCDPEARRRISGLISANVATSQAEYIVDDRLDISCVMTGLRFFTGLQNDMVIDIFERLRTGV